MQLWQGPPVLKSIDCQASLKLQDAEKRQIPNAHQWSSTICSACPGQDRFVKYRTNINKKTESTRSDLDLGWYSKEDMIKILKWPAKLPSNLLQVRHCHYCYIILRIYVGFEWLWWLNLFFSGIPKEEDCRCNQVLWSWSCEFGEARIIIVEDLLFQTLQNLKCAIQFIDLLWFVWEWFTFASFNLCARHCQYGGDDEYYVNVRETGKKSQQNENTEQTEEVTQDILFFLAFVSQVARVVEPRLYSHHSWQEHGGRPTLTGVNTSHADAVNERSKASRSSAVAATSEAL